jgi:hypothetical protein
LRVRSYKANSCRVCSPHTSKDGSNRALLEKDQSTVQDERSDGALPEKDQDTYVSIPLSASLKKLE